MGWWPLLHSEPHFPAAVFCHISTNPPLLHASACSTMNFSLYPSHFSSRFSGSKPNLSHKLSWNSSNDSSIPLMVLGMHVSHAPDFFPHISLCCSLACLPSSSIQPWTITFCAFARALCASI